MDNLADEREHKGAAYWSRNAAAGIIWGLGMSIKVTAGIPLLSVFLYLLLFRKRKDILKYLAVIASASVVVAGTNTFAASLPSKHLLDTYGAPTVTYFIGIGMKGKTYFQKAFHSKPANGMLYFFDSLYCFCIILGTSAYSFFLNMLDK